MVMEKKRKKEKLRRYHKLETIKQITLITLVEREGEVVKQRRTFHSRSTPLR